MSKEKNFDFLIERFRRAFYQNGVDMFEEKNDICFGKLNVNVTIGNIEWFDESIRIIEQS